MLQIYKPETTVRIKAINIDAIVLAVIISSNNRVSYDVRYWVDGESNLVTLEACEIESSSNRTKLGFING